jgi:ABC-2 type transport system ATP-binding protein
VERLCSQVGIIKQGKLVALEKIEDLHAKRMHVITVNFSDKFDKNDFDFDGVEIQQESSDGLILNVKGDINPLIQKLSKYKIVDLEITHATLEEVFLEFYQDGRS